MAAGAEDRAGLEAWLADSEARFRAVFDTSGAGVAISRGDAIVTYVNHAFARMLGYAPEELVGRSMLSLSPPHQDNPLQSGVSALRAGTRAEVTVERAYQHRDGHRVFAALSVHMLPIPPAFAAAAQTDKSLSRFVGIAHDITDRKRVEAENLESRRLLEEAQKLGKIGHWTWVAASGEVSWSEELRNILGVEPGLPPRIAGPFMSFILPEDLPGFRRVLHDLMTDQASATTEYRILRRDGEIRHVVGRSLAERRPDGSLVRMVGTIQDITDRKHDESVLREAMSRAEAANLAKTKFLAAMSHELRTPLNAILGFSQLLSLGTHGPLSPVQASYVGNIIQGGEHLLNLINDVLDLARIDTGKLALAPVAVDVCGLIEEVIAEFNPMAQGRGVTLLREAAVSAPRVMADRMRLTQVMVNLASNAIKYNRTGGSVTFAMQHRPNGRVRIVVRDTGRGIALARQAEVFESFNRLGAESTGEEGTGIGLSLSKRLVEEMGGVIGFESAAGTGSTFWIELPAAADEPPVDVNLRIAAG